MNNLKNIPSIDEMLKNERIKQLIEVYQRDFMVDVVRSATEELRRELFLKEEKIKKEKLMQAILVKVEHMVSRLAGGSLKEVINGTGVVLHTNLGRAPLGKGAIDYMVRMARSYNNLEFNLEKGERGERYGHVEEVLTRLTGAEAALVVNNNAAAVLLGLNTLAREREVIVSRGQLVEIGGAFRIPEVMKLSGARLVEVGTTNKTYISDFAAAINEETALLFAAHTSNYKILGFTQEVPLEELVKLGQEKELPVMQDLGSGIFYDKDDWGLREEPAVKRCVAAGVDIVTFSGDKLLGGPQAGIIVGKKALVEAMKKNQLTRALRVDKLTIAALEGTLLEYLLGSPKKNIPVIEMLALSREELREKAERLLELLEMRTEGLSGIRQLKLVELEDMVGGGAYPTYKIPGFGVEIEFSQPGLEKAAKILRLGSPALLTRRQEDKMLLSVRTLLPGDEIKVADLIAGVVQEKGDI
ncbi:L-seryl-tRNA(Sec) selenium transferase [Syntrophomonas wolfei]|uniref:L-seryl-tRNA(Sec) selenium transferase n=1 Tax=Syntrophomonas wolfei subsp. wolfei (strain DSM 2245B / Goettingen) TaxID=335541 RepID=Q0ATV6_SYNWW|nr:L-seryl-tRNA(Sec) selenium transferase [Syntrophomonas wolfei]ABI69848.1 L-seryl-tRNA(Sec) selenium transferase [Syntrophomonas wolfei subsp. wolfei str. Goettingen G311]